MAPTEDPRAASTPSGEARQQIELISETRDEILDIDARRGLVKTLEGLKGELVPTCACGLREFAKSWTAPWSRSKGGVQQHIQHKHWAELDRHQQFAAHNMAEEALRHAAQAWTGGGEVARGLEGRAEVIKSGGRYDGDVWP